MAHYDEFYEEQFKYYQDNDKELWKKQPLKSWDSSLLNYYNVNEKNCLEQDYAEWEMLSSKPQIKDVNNKPHGARYCFLDVLADANDSLTLGFGCLLDNLVDDTLSKLNKTTILKNLDLLKYHLFMIAERDKINIIDELITLRYDVINKGKYTKNGYKTNINISLLLDALARHYIKYTCNIKYDKESGHSHLSHIFANLLLIKYQVEHYYE